MPLLEPSLMNNRGLLHPERCVVLNQLGDSLHDLLLLSAVLCIMCLGIHYLQDYNILLLLPPSDRPNSLQHQAELLLAFQNQLDAH